MIEFQAKPFIDVQEILVQLSIMMHSQDRRFFPTMSDVHKNDVRKFINALTTQLKLLDLQACQKSAERMLATIDRTSDTREIIIDVECLRRQILDHIETIFCISLSYSSKKLYSPDCPLFGDHVEKAFPHLSEDISEAGKCLALHRFTACVFHLMRAMEASLFSLCEKIGATYSNKHGGALEWGIMLSNISEKIKTIPPGNMKDEWSEVITLLYHVKQAWRNSTMHPKQTYTEEEANDIFGSVKSFMAKLSTLI